MSYHTSATVIKNVGNTLSVVTVPDGIPIDGVEIPDIGDRNPPTPGSTVKIWVLGAFGARLDSVVASPKGDVELAREKQSGSEPGMQPGEREITTKYGSSLFFNREGDICLTSSGIKERLDVSAADEAISGQAGLIEFSALTINPALRPIIEADGSGLLGGYSRLAIEAPLLKVGSIKAIIHKIEVDSLGNIQLSNLIGSFRITAAGTATLFALTTSITSTTSTSINSPNFSVTGLIASIKAPTSITLTTAKMTVTSAATTISGTLAVGGAITSTGPISGGGTAAITGNTTLGGTLAVAGTLGVTGTQTNTGATIINGALAINGAVTVGIAPGVSGIADATKSITFVNGIAVLIA